MARLQIARPGETHGRYEQRESAAGIKIEVKYDGESVQHRGAGLTPKLVLFINPIDNIRPIQ